MAQGNESLGKRLAFYIDYEGLNKKQFTERVKMDYAQLHRIIKGESEPGMETLKKILKSFPHLSLTWLISGRGNIYEPSLKEFSELKSLDSWKSKYPLNPFACLYTYIDEQTEWYMLKAKMREKGIFEEPLRDRLVSAFHDLHMERRNLDMKHFREQRERELTEEEASIQSIESGSIIDSIHKFIDFSEMSQSHYLYKKYTEKNGITD